METIKLRRLQQPSDVEKLLGAYVWDSGLLPNDAHQIRDRAELSKELRRILGLAIGTGQAWSCWAHNLHTWLFTAEISVALSRERGAPVLQASASALATATTSAVFLPHCEQLPVQHHPRG